MLAVLIPVLMPAYICFSISYGIHALADVNEFQLSVFGVFCIEFGLQK